MLPPSARALRMTFIAVMWSIPGSTPSSLKRMTPLARAAASSAFIGSRA
jgi:hypothetical protein